MNDMVRCSQCKGRKKIMGMGFILKNCDTCQGVGCLPSIQPQFAALTPANQSEIQNKPTKKRGRPKKHETKI